MNSIRIINNPSQRFYVGYVYFKKLIFLNLLFEFKKERKNLSF